MSPMGWHLSPCGIDGCKELHAPSRIHKPVAATPVAVDSPGSPRANGLPGRSGAIHDDTAAPPIGGDGGVSGGPLVGLARPPSRVAHSSGLASADPDSNRRDVTGRLGG